MGMAGSEARKSSPGVGWTPDGTWRHRSNARAGDIGNHDATSDRLALNRPVTGSPNGIRNTPCPRRFREYLPCFAWGFSGSRPVNPAALHSEATAQPQGERPRPAGHRRAGPRVAEEPPGRPEAPPGMAAAAVAAAAGRPAEAVARPPGREVCPAAAARARGGRPAPGGRMLAARAVPWAAAGREE